MLGRPLFRSLFVGLILGDVQQGVIVGAALEPMFMGAIMVGAAVPPEVYASGVLGCAFAAITGTGTATAVALALPVSVFLLYSVINFATRIVAAHLHLLPLGLVDEQLTGLGTLEGADDAPFLHLIHQTGGTGIAQLQAALEHGDGGLSRFQNHLHGGRQQLIAVLLRFGRFGRGLSSPALFLLLQMCPPRFYAVKYLFSAQRAVLGSI